MDKLLSERAIVSRDREDFLSKYISVCNSDPYDETENPQGYINFGTAVNNMCNDIVHPRLNDVWACDFNFLGYDDDFGTLRLRETMAKLLTELFESHEPVSADNLFCLTGVTSCIDAMAHCLADAGEVFLVPAPMYGCIYRDFMYRALVEVWPVNVISEGIILPTNRTELIICHLVSPPKNEYLDPFLSLTSVSVNLVQITKVAVFSNDTDEYPALTLEKIVHAYESAVAANRVVRGIFLINPSNPLGDVYSPQLLMDVVSFCNQKSLHLVVDELYALSVFSESEKFHSILKFPSLPNPETVHVLYGLSKDFGLAGLRVGVIHTRCKPLQKCLIQLSALQTIPYPVMEITATFLDDLGWCRRYVRTFRERLAEKYAFCINFLSKIGVKIRKCSAGCFLWVDLRHLCSSFEDEWMLFEYLLDEVKLYINPGKEFACAQPGWFRIVFIQSHLKQGLERLKEALEKYKPSIK